MGPLALLPHNNMLHYWNYKVLTTNRKPTRSTRLASIADVFTVPHQAAPIIIILIMEKLILNHKPDIIK